MPLRTVLFLISSLELGGAERQTIALLNGLDPGMFSTVLCYLDPQHPTKPQLFSNLSFRTHCLGRIGKFSLHSVGLLLRRLRSMKPEIVVSINLYPSLYVHLTRLLAGFPFKLVQVMHSTEISGFRNRLVTKALYVPLANRADRVVFVCRNQMNFWINKYGIRSNSSECIYNGVDFRFFSQQPPLQQQHELKERLGILPSEAVVVSCGALRPEKCYTDLLDACTILRHKGIQAKLVLVGDGDERNRIHEHARKSGSFGHLVITGYQSDVRPYIGIADVFALSSKTEAFPMAVLEAMAAGKPIVASNVGGLPEQVTAGENGFLYPTGDISSLAESLERIITNGLRDQMGLRSKHLVHERFSLDRMIQSYTNLFLSL